MEGSAKRRPIGESDGIATTEGGGTALSSGYDYEVFLSFRGPDTRLRFTDFLYTSLTDVGIRTFKDDEDLRKGEEFAPELLQAIKQSKILIPIFSKDYASSAWCLKELVQMVECKKTRRQKIMPIFYDVAPLEVRQQTGGYGEAFRLHENKKRWDKKTMQDWKNALSAVSAIDGWDLHGNSKREGQLVKTIMQKVFGELKKAYLLVSKCLVNVDNHVDAIMELIGARTSETRIIGIHGMGGIGKTTTAKIIYNQLSKNFESCCFLSDIREMSKCNGIQYLQRQLISSILKNNCTDITSIDDGKKIIKDRLSKKTVLLLLDDMHEKREMDALVGERNWFGKGSKIIITTRNKEILDALKVDDRYELTGMDRNQSLQLFSKHAFRKDSPLDEYIDQSNKVIDIAKGLPLALEVIGSLLSHTEKKKWNDILEKLENVPHMDVRHNLKISYDALEVQHRYIFLDIACFFIGSNKDVVVYFWEKSKFFPKEAMEVLQNMSLIKIEEDNRVWMHDQLRDLGTDIVREESNMKIEMQSRVWDPKEALDLLRRHEGKKEIEALCLKFDHERQYQFTYEGFMGLSNLRFLAVKGSMENFCIEERLLWHESPSNVFPTNVYLENSDLLPQLRWLSWHGIPPTLKITNFSMEDMVILDLSNSKITYDWEGWNHMKVMKNLKVLNLSNCTCFERIPTFSTHSNLERLILWGCESLFEIDESICQLNRLLSLDVSYCKNLQKLPDELGDLASLEYLSLRECVSLERLPDTIGNLKSLIELDISNCQHLKRTPNFSAYSNLERLILLGCKSLIKIDKSICQLKCLVSLNASRCKNLQRLPDELGGDLANLEYLFLSECKSLERLPDTIGNLKSLIELDISNCQHLKRTPNFFAHSNLECLNLSGCESLIEIDRSVCQLKHLVSLDVSHCKNLQRLPDELGEDFASLEYLFLSECKSLEKLPDTIGNLELLIELDISNCQRLKRTPNFFAHSNLKRLMLSGCTSLIEIDRSICQLKSLVSLDVSHCKNLQRLPDELGGDLASLEYLSLSECKSLEKLPDTIGNLESLIELDISNCQRLKRTPNFSAHSNLKRLKLSGCTSLIEIDRLICQLKSLVSLDISYCKNLRRLPDELSGDLASLEYLSLSECTSLEKLPDTIGNLESLIELDISNTRIKELPDSIGKLKRLKVVKMQRSDIRKIPDAFWMSQKLEELEATKGCSLKRCHVNQSLKILRLLSVDIYTLPPRLPESLVQVRIYDLPMNTFPDLSNLTNLKELGLTFFTRYSIGRSHGPMEDPIPQWIGNLTKLESLHLSFYCETASPTDLSLPPQLKSLQLRCPNLRRLPRLPSSLSSLRLFNCMSLCSMEDLSNLKNLSSLNISDAAITEIQGLGCLENLGDLNLSCLKQVERLPDLCNLNKLSCLQVSKCCSLFEIQGELPRLLDSLHISSCPSLQNLPNLSSLKVKKKVEINFCSKLNVKAILSFSRMNLEYLHLVGCKQLQILPDLSNSNELRCLKVSCCDNLDEIQGDLPQSLEELEISSCMSLQKLPNLSNLKELLKVKINRCQKLNVEAILGFARKNSLDLQLQILTDLRNSDEPRHLRVENCGNLVEIQGELPNFLEKLDISFCESLYKLPDLSSFVGLREVCISTCGNLVEIQGKLPQFLEELKISSCKSLQKLPDLSSLKGLRRG